MRRLTLATLLVAFPLALTVWDIDEKISDAAPSLEPYVSWIPWAAAGLLALFVLVLIVEVIALAIAAIQRIQPSTLANAACRRVRSADIPEIVALARESMGSRITKENTDLLYNHNRLCLRKIVNTQDNTLMGYFCILPLTAHGEERVIERDLIDGGIDITSFAKTFRKGTSVYIGSMAANSKKGRAATLELLKVTLSNLEISKVYTRPVTKHGLRLVKKFGFKPVNEHDRIQDNVYVMRVREVF